MTLNPKTQQETEQLADELLRAFTPPELITGCEVVDISDKSIYATENGWIDAVVGVHNQQRCRWRGQLRNVQVGDFVDVLYYPSYKLFMVFGSSGLSAVKPPVATYDDLDDTPGDKVGHYHKVPNVNQAETDHLYNYRMDYQGDWTSQEYPPHAVVTRNGYTSVSNKTTTDLPDPTVIDPPEYILPDDITSDPDWTTANHTGAVWFGMYIEVIEGAWSATEVRFWVFDVSGDTTYTLFWENELTGEFSQVLQVNGNVLTAPGWLTVGISSGFVVPGDEFIIWVLTQTNSATTQFSGFWDYTSSNQDVTPVAGQFHRRNNRSYIQVSKTDDDGGDRSADFANIIIGTTITSPNGANYSVTGITDNGTWMQFDISGDNPTVSGRQNFTFDIPVAAPTPYGYVNNFFVGLPSEYGLLQGAIALDSNPATFNNNGYPVEAKWQRWEQSPDWDIISSPGAGGGGGGDGAQLFTELDDTPPDYVGHSGKILIVDETETSIEFAAPLPGTAEADYRWLTDTTATDPTAGRLKVNNVDITLATELYISATDLFGTNREGLFNFITRYDFLVIRDHNGADAYVYRATDDGTDNGDWWTFGVENLGAVGSHANNERVVFAVLINPVNEFTDLNDTPPDYIGQANKLVSVNGAATGLEFIEPSTITSEEDTWDLQYKFNPSTSDSDPGAGYVALDDTWAFGSVNYVYISRYDAAGNDRRYILDAVRDLGYITLLRDDKESARVYRIIDASMNFSTYYRVPVTQETTGGPNSNPALDDSILLGVNPGARHKSRTNENNYKFNATVLSGDDQQPGDGYVAFDNATGANVTRLYVSKYHFSYAGALEERAWLLSPIIAGTHITTTQAYGGTSHTYTVENATEYTRHYELDVTYADGIGGNYVAESRVQFGVDLSGGGSLPTGFIQTGDYTELNITSDIVVTPGNTWAQFVSFTSPVLNIGDKLILDGIISIRLYNTSHTFTYGQVRVVIGSQTKDWFVKGYYDEADVTTRVYYHNMIEKTEYIAVANGTVTITIEVRDISNTNVSFRCRPLTQDPFEGSQDVRATRWEKVG